jgi:hypothetical protein
MSVLSLDKKNRLVLDKKLREASGVKKGAKLVAIPFKGGVMLVDVTGKSFVGSMNGFGFREEEHEASKFLFGKKAKDNAGS